MTEKQELEALRRQKREWELERANLLAEHAHLETKVKDLGIAFTKQCFELEEAKHKMTLYHQVLTKDCEAQAQPVDSATEREVLDGPDDIDAERMQGTADHDPESLVGEEAYE
tara:strand:+ start:696 stop:1034 length:339 start_codon:yes stop_codon:yes gene_type:complete